MGFVGNFGNRDEWINYLQNKSFFDDLSSNFSNAIQGLGTSIAENQQTIMQRADDAIARQSYQLRNYLSGMTEELSKTFFSSIQCLIEATELETKKITETMVQGFTMLAQQNREAVQKLSNMEKQLTIQNDQLKVSNLIACNIAELLRIPEFQKERQYYIEQGLKFFANALIDESLINDAIEMFIKAFEIDKTDYFVAYRLGMIYLYAIPHISFDKAEYYFKIALKYASVESDPRAIVLVDLLQHDVNSDYGKITVNKDKIMMMAAEAAYQAGLTCHLQQKYDEAVMLLEKARIYNCSIPEYTFMLAKSLCANQEGSRAVAYLEDLFKKHPEYIIKTIFDTSLLGDSSINEMIKKIRDNKVEECYLKLEKFKQTDDPQVNEFIYEIKTMLSKNTYSDAQLANQLLTRSRQWKKPEIKSISIKSTTKMKNGMTMFFTVFFDNILLFSDPIVYDDDFNFLLMEYKLIESYRTVADIIDIINCESMYILPGCIAVCYLLNQRDKNCDPKMVLVDIRNTKVIYENSLSMRIKSPVSYCVGLNERIIMFINDKDELCGAQFNNNGPFMQFAMRLGNVPKSETIFIGFNRDDAMIIYSDYSKNIGFYDIKKKHIIIPKDEELKGYAWYASVYDSFKNNMCMNLLDSTFDYEKVSFDRYDTKTYMPVNEYLTKIGSTKDYQKRIDEYIALNTKDDFVKLIEVERKVPVVDKADNGIINNLGEKPIEKEDYYKKAHLVEKEYNLDKGVDDQMGYSNAFELYRQAHINHQMDKRQFTETVKKYLDIADQLMEVAVKLKKKEALKFFGKDYSKALRPCEEAYKIHRVYKKSTSKINVTELRYSYEDVVALMESLKRTIIKR